MNDEVANMWNKLIVADEEMDRDSTYNHRNMRQNTATWVWNVSANLYNMSVHPGYIYCEDREMKWAQWDFGRSLCRAVIVLPAKAKVKLSLCFNWAPRHEGVLGEWRYSSNHSLTSALNGGEWSASRPGRFTPRERAPGTHWIGGWVGPRAVLDAVV
jgi:hypothetical protein